MRASGIGNGARTPGKLALSSLVGALALCSPQAAAAMQAGDEGARLVRVAADLDRLESIRAIKRLQLSYAQYSEFGLWSEMADLFSNNAKLEYGKESVSGRAAIARWLKTRFGRGQDGLPAGGLHTQMTLIPVVNLSADGKTAKGRWHELSLIGRYGADASWAGGIQENEYVREGGVWKIARLHHYAIYEGPYDKGWLAIGPNMDVIPYHFTPGEAGAPIGPRSTMAATGGTGADPASIDGRLARMRDEDLVRNLQNAYGYYIDRKMWTDVTDLFTADGTFEIAGIGVWKGEQGIRRLLGRDGPSDLGHGEVNDHLQLDTIITVSPDGREAWARGLDFGMIGQNNQFASWTEAVFENHYVKSGGVWRIQAARLFPKLRTDYYQGWAKSQMPEPKPTRGYEPDAPSTVPELAPATAWIPEFRTPNPVTGKPVRYPVGVRVVTTGGALQVGGAPAGEGGPVDASELERRLAVELAYDSVENVSSAFAGYLDDFDWDKTSATFAKNGRREKYQVGFYATRERVRLADLSMYGPQKKVRTSVTYHLRTQPVIDVAPDGKSAKLRTRLFSYSASTTRPGGFNSGVYPNDLLIPEDGSWKFLHQAINEPYFSTPTYALGWAKVPEADPKMREAVRPRSMMDKLREELPPDVHTIDLGVRGRGFTPGPEFIQFPDIKPMWFHYVNPVSGRVPPNYCPDESTCYQQKPLFK